MKHESPVVPSRDSMKVVRLELPQKRLEFSLTEVLRQDRNQRILIVDLEGLTLKTPRNDVAVIIPIRVVQKDVQLRGKMLAIFVVVSLRRHDEIELN